MALLKYFTHVNSSSGTVLPNPESSLNRVVDWKAIEAANEEVTKIRSEGKGVKQRSPYLKATPAQKALVGKYAAEHGVMNSIRRFQKDFTSDALKESTVRGWRDEYLRQLRDRKQKGEDLEVSELPLKKIGHPLLLGEDIDKQVQAYLMKLREVGGVVNSAIARASARGIIRMTNPKLLASNGGHIVLTKKWSKYLLKRMGFVKRKANSKARANVDDFVEVKTNYLADIRAIISLEEVPPCLVINWDHTGLKYVPVSSWTMAKEGSKKVLIAGIEDKRQITAVFALPPQLIYKGKTTACLPLTKFPSNWHITFTPTHWANEVTTLAYIDQIILPYIKRKRRVCGLPNEQCALCIFDNFKAQLTGDVLKMLEDNNVDVVYVPSNYTDCLQLLIGGGTRGALGALAPTKFVNAHRNLVFHNRNVSC